MDISTQKWPTWLENQRKTFQVWYPLQERSLTFQREAAIYRLQVIPHHDDEERQGERDFGETLTGEVELRQAKSAIKKITASTFLKWLITMQTQEVRLWAHACQNLQHKEEHDQTSFRITAKKDWLDICWVFGAKVQKLVHLKNAKTYEGPILLLAL